MQDPFRNGQFPAGNPIANALVVIAGVFVIGLAIVLGVVAFVALGSVLLVLGAIIGIRVWWLNRRYRREFARQQPSGGRRTDGRVDVIEGEYREVRRRDH